MTSAPTTCRSCHAPIAWGDSPTGKRTPYDVVDDRPTTIGQFAQAHEEVRTEHILPLADRLLAWVEQP